MSARVRIIAPLAAIAVATVAQPALASATLTESLNDILPTNAVLLNFNSYYPFGNPGTYSPPTPITIGGATVTFAPGAYLAKGNIDSVVAAPIVSQSIGRDTNAYPSAEPGDTVTIQYAAAQGDFGLLWGSIDAYNTLSFYDCASGGTDCAPEYSLTGSDIFADPNGFQGYGGSSYVNIAFDDEVFTAVQAFSGSPAFEFDFVKSVAAGTPPLFPTPEPATWAMLLLGLFGLGFMVRGARRKNSATTV
jgi:hypothetical protein